MLLRRSSVVGSGISRLFLWDWTDIRDAQKPSAVPQSWGSSGRDES